MYYDDTALPLYPISDAGLRLAAHFYNSNMARHGGSLEAVLNGKVLSVEQRKAMVWDIERGLKPSRGHQRSLRREFHKQGVSRRRFNRRHGDFFDPRGIDAPVVLLKMIDP